MNSNYEKMQKAREIALKNAKRILKESGLDENHKWYSLRQYEMQFAIYHQLRQCMDITNKD